jgi:hypothetical protein
MKKSVFYVHGSILLFIVLLISSPGFTQENLPHYLQDRGTGIATSLFGTYINKGELLVYPFFEYSRDHDREYQPAQFNLGSDQDFLARYHGYSGQIFLGYGLTDWLAFEIEAAYLSATFEKSPNDTSAVPAKIKESGIGDFEGELRLRLSKENEHRPEIFSYLEVTAPSQKNKLLIGDPDWDFKPGIGITRGFSWGTMTFRTDLEYNREASKLDIGETALEYLKRLTPFFRLYLGIEGGEGGAPDEWDLNTGIQWRITNSIYLKFDNALGITPKATDWAPQIGCLFAFPLRSR